MDLFADILPLYEKLLVQEAQRRLPGSESEDFLNLVALSDAAKLLSAASHLAMEKDPEPRTLAYEIATKILAIEGLRHPGVIVCAELVLSRLGNFPGRDLLQTRFGVPKTSDPLLHLEMRSHEIENTIIDAGGQKRRLTDFQYDLLHSFRANSKVSVSAPTSAGKSFLLTLEVMRKLSTAEAASIVYIVPTRALIRQVVVDLRKIFQESNLPPPLVRSLPQFVAKASAPNGIVYVLTQERLLSLIAGSPNEDWLNALIVDEAQTIRDGARGILLQTAIERALLKFPRLQLIFASPLAKNPEFFFGLFEIAHGHSLRERHSPVSQNLFLVDPCKAGVSSASFSILHGDKKISLGSRNLSFSFQKGSSFRRRALFARAISNPEDPDDCCIIYANGARAAEKIANHLIRHASPEEPDRQIDDFVSFLKDHIHPNYNLAKTLLYGVAFHYGNMPGSVRAGVEELFRNRKVRFLVCTSTLLQGVNLPARHIVVEAPTRGKKQPMQRGDFLNLAGRAGRLTKEFHGNVWCLWPDRWPVRSYQGERAHQIDSAFEMALISQGPSIRAALDGEKRVKNSEVPVAAIGRIFTEYILESRVPPAIANVVASGNTSMLVETFQLLSEFGKKARLPKEMFSRNSGIHPLRLEALYEFLSEQPSLDDFIPIKPHTKGTNPRLKIAFAVVQRILAGVDNEAYTYHATIASDWIHEKPLNAILSDRLAYKQGIPSLNGEKKINTREEIRSIITTIEQDVRFRYVKQMRAYNDILEHILTKRGFNPSELNIPPMHVYLECGAYRPATLSLISLGFSRIAALILGKKIILSSDSTPEECLEKCAEALTRARNLTIPIEVRNEVRSLLGREI